MPILENNLDVENIDVMMEIGDTGLKRQNGWISEDFLRQMRNLDRRIENFKEMRDNDATIGAILFAISMLIKRVEWRVEEASDFVEDIEAAEFLQSCMDDMSDTWADTIDEILSMLPFGFSYHEIVYKRRMGQSKDVAMNSKFSDGKIGWRKLPIRSQDTIYRWVYADNSDDLLGMIQQDPNSYKHVFVPYEKALLFRPGAHKNSPEGKSILRNAYSSFYKKKHIENIEGIGIERDLAGLPIARVPPEIMKATASPEQKAIYEHVKQIVVNIRRDEQEGLVFPSSYDENGHLQYDIQLLTTGGTRQFDTSVVIDRYKQDIASTVLADFILLGHQGTGSYALASSKTSLFATAIGAYLESIAQVFNRCAVPKLFALNNMSLEALPKISYGDIETVDLTELGDFVSKLAGAGVQLFPDEKIENWLKRQAGMPVEQLELETQDEAEDDDESVEDEQLINEAMGLSNNN